MWSDGTHAHCPPVFRVLRVRSRTLSTLATLLTSSLLLGSCASVASSSAGATSTTLAPTGGRTVDLAVTPTVRQSLLDAAAAYHQLPASDYTGLRARETYYAYDGATHRYYAAAGLAPSATSLKAQVSTQDDGAYNLFTRAAGTTKWTVYNDGLGGAEDSICPLALPASILSVWGWKKGSCFPSP